MITRTRNATVNPYVSCSSIQVTSVMFYVAYGLYSIGAFLELTTFYEVLGVSREDFVSALQAFALALLIIKFFTQRASFLGWCCAVAVVLLGFASWRMGDEGWFFWLVLFIVCSDGVRIRTLAGITLGIVITLTLFTVLSCCLGLIDNRSFARVDRLRYSWGFKHPNNFGAYLLVMCVCYSVLRFGRNPFPDVVLVTIVFFFNLAVLDSRSSAALALVQIALLLIFHLTQNDKIRRIMSVLFIVGIAIVIAVSLFFMIYYDSANPIHKLLNDLMSLRLSLAHGYYSLQPLTIFGSDFIGFPPLYWENGEPAIFIVDNAFCHLVLRSGVVSMVVFVCGLFLLLRKLTKDGRWDELLFGIVLMTIYGFGETLGIRVECNFFLIAIGTDLIFNTKRTLLFSKESRSVPATVKYVRRPG